MSGGSRRQGQEEVLGGGNRRGSCMGQEQEEVLRGGGLRGAGAEGIITCSDWSVRGRY